MSSIIPGYEYDIFISYRQKDNKGDRWVSEFVEALKTELESTFKEEISVFFDINPHDGLLETHDVDASLKDKLKCLVFIPIISRTYCDPKSFAWEHEFKAFVEQASKDQFGLKVKLPNGNVANRVLPIRIHDLDPEDIKLCESVLGGVLRGVEFIYKEPGVNKPLTGNDNENKNLNNTNYKIQINKTANAIKEIVSGLKTVPVGSGGEEIQLIVVEKEVNRERSIEEQEKPVKLKVFKLLSGLLITALLIILAILAYPKIFRHDKLEDLRSSDGRISVAVMPFLNMTNDTIWNVWQVGIQDMLIAYLSNFSDELKVRQKESVNSLMENRSIINYTSLTPVEAGKISQKLDAGIFIFGSIKKAGNKLRIDAQLINAKTEEVYKSFETGGPAKEEMIFQITDSLNKMVKNYLVVSKLKQELSPEFRKFVYTDSPEAYRYYISGLRSFLKYDYTAAVPMFARALALDSNFYAAAIILSFAYGNPGNFDEAKKVCLGLYHKKDKMPDYLRIQVDAIYAKYFETFNDEIRYYRQMQEIDDQVPVLYYNIGGLYDMLFQYDQAIPELEKGLNIYEKWDVKPAWAGCYTNLGYAYHKTGQFKKEKELYKKAEKDFPDDQYLKYLQVVLSLTEGDSIAAKNYLDKYISICKSRSFYESDISTELAKIYTEAGILDKAEQYYRKAISSIELTSNNSWYFNNLAVFLIDNDRNIEEGIILADKILKLSPYDYNFLETKGWALYKGGKYNEALDILQKSWDLRLKNAVYDHRAFLHLEAAKRQSEI